MIKPFFQAAVLCVALAACTAVPDAGQSDAGQIPTAAQTLEQTARVAELSVVQPEKRTIAYYDAQGNPTTEPAAGGFYRVLHGRNAQGKPVVQDFYQDSQTKQVNASVITDDAKINSFAVEDTEGRTIWYSPQGHIRSFADIENGRAVRAGYYDDGSLRFAIYEPDEKRMYKTSYHANGRPKVKFVFSAEGESYTVYDEQGKVLGVSDAKQPLPAADAPQAKAVRAALEEFFNLSASPPY